MYKIKKTFELCYAHRLFGYPGKCGNIHGHTAKVEVTCSADKLQENGIAIDFKDLSKKIGSWIEENIDHRLVLYRDDPIAKVLKDNKEDVLELENQPSAENLAELVFKAVKSLGFPVSKVAFWESPSSCAKFLT